MSLLADLLSTLFERRYQFAGVGGSDARSMEDLCRDLLGGRGAVSGLALAHTVLERYRALDDDGRRGFFEFLATGLDIDPTAIQSALTLYTEDATENRYRRLMEVVDPPRQELTRRLNQAPGATGRLVEMRCDLLRFLGDNPALSRVDLDFLHLFSSWFNRGFLVLRRINWTSPAHILEKIIAYEAVHAIDSWDDLRSRLEPDDRRCFAYFHPAMPDEPLIFVEVALTGAIPNSIQDLLVGERETIAGSEATTAVFYSISNCQRGLAGVSFGNALIKQVVEDLSAELPQLKTFVTLSPIPGLMEWLGEIGLKDRTDDPEMVRKLAARYLLDEKSATGEPRDAVARFHLNNGALVHEIHADADTSPNGRSRSAGAMVNYLYDLKQISRNHEMYANERKIAASSKIRDAAKSARGLESEDS